MVLDRSDYNVRRLATGGVDPAGDPTGTVKLLAGTLVVGSLALWAWRFSQAKGFPLVDRLMGRVSGGRLSASGQSGGDRILG